MSADPALGLSRLREAAASGELDAVCLRHGVRILSAFGSAARGAAMPRDLDVAVDFERAGDVLALLEALVTLTGCEQLDLMDLRRAGPVARERALVGAVPLFENRPGAYAAAQLAAVMERMETDWLRRLDLEAMAG